MNAPASSAENSDQIDPEQIFSGINFPPDSAIVAAVSGGSDSVALLLLLKAFADKALVGRRLVAITVDHGLRAESAEEAKMVAALCEKIGVEHRTVKWEGEKPETGISVAAREARYTLLMQASEDLGPRVILTGHTQDDQVETHVMRASRGEGRGLAAMAPATLLDGRVWLLRPLLGIRRQALRQYLSARGIGWSDDPTNEKEQYERVRIRKDMTASRFAEAQSAIDENVRQRLLTNAAAADFLTRKVSVPQPGLAVLPAGTDIDVEDEAMVLGLGALLAVLGGRSFIPSREDCRPVAMFLRDPQKSGRINHQRCIIQKAARQTRIYREMRGLAAFDLPTGQSVIWDSRYRIRNAGGQMVRVRAAGDDARIGSEYPTDVYRPALRSQPVIRYAEAAGEASVSLNALCVEWPDISVEIHFAPFDRFLSGYDVILANSVARLFGRPPYPELPLKMSVNQNCKK